MTTFDDHPWAWAEQEAGTRTPRESEGSRWNDGKDLSFVPLRPERVVEVRYDHMQGRRFRHTDAVRPLASRPRPPLLHLRAARPPGPLRARRDRPGPRRSALRPGSTIHGVDPNLRTCGRKGHATYRPDEADLAARLHAETAIGTAWRCLRCGDFVVGEPAGSGPAAERAGAAARQGAARRDGAQAARGRADPARDPADRRRVRHPALPPQRGELPGAVQQGAARRAAAGPRLPFRPRPQPDHRQAAPPAAHQPAHAAAGGAGGLRLRGHQPRRGDRSVARQALGRVLRDGRHQRLPAAGDLRAERARHGPARRACSSSTLRRSCT